MESLKKKWFWGIFISLLTFFAMSHNASALNINYEYYDIVRNNSRFDTTCRLQSGTIISGSTYCRFNAEATMMRLKSIYTTTYLNNLKAGDLVEYYIFVNNRLNYAIQGGVLTLLGQEGIDSLLTISVDVVDDYNFLKYVVDAENLPGENVGYVSDFWSLLQYGKVYKVVQRVPLDGNYRVGFNISSTSENNYLFGWYQSENNTLEFALRELTVYRPLSESRENQEVEEKTQEAVDESESAGSSSSQSAQSGTTGLLNAITGAVSVISSAQPTNCKINGNMGNLDIGQLDLCANPAPAFVQTIGSLILILMCVPLAISLFNRFIAIFRSFQS